MLRCAFPVHSRPHHIFQIVLEAGKELLSPGFQVDSVIHQHGKHAGQDACGAVQYYIVVITSKPIREKCCSAACQEAEKCQLPRQVVQSLYGHSKGPQAVHLALQIYTCVIHSLIHTICIFCILFQSAQIFVLSQCHIGAFFN